MRQKILLISPNFQYFPGLFGNLVNYKQSPLGLMYIASFIRESYPIMVRIFDASTLNVGEKEVLKYINVFKPDIIGITATTLTVQFVRTIAFQAKHLLPDVFIVFGGPHVTALPFENLDVADVCVIGEGEQTFAEVINNFLKGLSLDKIRGIVFKEKSAYYKTEERELIQDLDELPFPARDLLPKHTFCHIFPYRLENPYYDTIITSRGCSFNCTFCLNELMWKRKVRYRSLDNVFEEIEELIKKYSTSLLFIHDDNFTENSDRLIEFCKIKQKYFPKLKWICHSRADSLSLDLLKEMESAGCVEIQIGVESGDDRILNNCNKRIKITTIYNAFKLFKKTKINTWATFIIGNEGETKDSIEKTIKFAKNINPTYCSFLFLSPLPGTRCFNNFKKRDYIKTYDWFKYSWHGEPVFETESLSKGLLMGLRKKAYRRFYLRPKILFRYLCICIKSRQWKTMFSNFLILLKSVLGLIKK